MEHFSNSYLTDFFVISTKQTYLGAFYLSSQISNLISHFLWKLDSPKKFRYVTHPNSTLPKFVQTSIYIIKKVN